MNIVLLAIAMSWGGRTDGWVNSGSLEAMGGGSSNPLLLSDTSTRRESASLLRGQIKDKIRYRTGSWQFELAGAGSGEFYPGASLANDNEIRLQPSVRWAGRRGLHPWVELGWLSLLSDNSLLMGSERFDPQGARQGENRQRGELHMGVRSKPQGKFHADLAWQRRDFQELPMATSLDRDQWEAAIGWEGLAWGGVALSIDLDLEDRSYRAWPARYVWGDAVPGLPKRLRSYGAEIVLGSMLFSDLELEGKFKLLVRQDLAWGYFDEINPTGAVSARWTPDSLWTTRVSIRWGREVFSRYHDNYDPRAGIKAIGSGNAKAELIRTFGRLEILGTVSGSFEKNSNPRYTWTLLQGGLGFRLNY